MLGGAFAAGADGQTTSERAAARIGTRRARRRIAQPARMLLVVRPHGRMLLPPPPAAYTCRLRSRLATEPDAGARRRWPPPRADDTRRCTTARRFGPLPVSARSKGQRLETLEAHPRKRQEMGQQAGLLRAKTPGILGRRSPGTPGTCGLFPGGTENPAARNENVSRHSARTDAGAFRTAQRGTRPCR